MIYAAMAVLGIGGGLAGLWWGWLESIREGYARRTWGDYGCELWISGRPVPIAGPITLNLAPASAPKIEVSGKMSDNGTYLIQRWPS